MIDGMYSKLCLYINNNSVPRHAILSKELKISHGYQYNTQFALDDALLEADVLTG